MALPKPDQIFSFMQQALQLAEKGLYTTSPNPRVGCVIVKNNQIVGQGFHQQTGEPHAEVYALQQAGEQAQGADVYVTLEPCSHYGRTPPCANALVNAGVKRVFIASLDPNPLVAGKGVKMLEAAGIYVYSGILAKQAGLLNKGFFKRMRQNMPWLTLKMAMSLDGRTAMASGESKWVTGAAARHEVQKMRARSSAVLTSIKTVLADNPSMNVRINNDLNLALAIKQPLRVVLDRKGELTGKEQILHLEGEVLVYSQNSDLVARLKNLPQVEVIVQPEAPHLSLETICQDLAKREINEVHIECGPELGGVWINSGLLDELVIFMAAKLMGSNALPLFHLPIDKMSDSINVNIESIRPIGQDYRINIRFP